MTGWIQRLASWPVFMCGFRPFFLLTAVSAVVLMLVWMLVLVGILPWLHLPGGMLLWHGHELLFAMASAAVAGFALTAVPEFSHSRQVPSTSLVPLVLLWLLARLAYPLAGLGGGAYMLWPAALCNLLFWVLLLMELLPKLLSDAGRGHLGFAWNMLALAAVQLGFFVSLILGGQASNWLYLAAGLLMVLIILAASRVSMAVMNGLVEQGKPGLAEPQSVYLARPPRRHLAVFTILLCSATEFVLGGGAVVGWLALAVCAAMLNLLQDWHVGRALFSRWALMLYGSYWLIALGYGLMGFGWLGGEIPASAGRHMLMVGAMSLAILVIMAQVTRIHSGLWLDQRLWLPLAGMALVLATGLRVFVGAGLGGNWYMVLLIGSGLIWVAVFLTYLCFNARILVGPRSDGQRGCAEPLGRVVDRH